MWKPISLNSEHQTVPILKSAQATHSYQTTCWFAYQDYLDPSDGFTKFVCERFEEKQAYLGLINTLLAEDKTAKVFVQVFPSGIGPEWPGFARQSFVIGEHGDLLPAEGFCEEGFSAYYCWWD